MKTLIGLTALLLATATGCSAGADRADTVATDPAPTTSTTPAPSSPVSNPVPTAVPAAPGPVSSRGLVTVIDSGAGPQVCLGPIAEIYPPMCGGPALTNWDWDTLGRGMSEQEGATRWGTYLVTGRWDGVALTVDSAVPAALYDAAPEQSAPTPSPATSYPPAELEAIATRLGQELPGVGAA
ncbi:MAG: hypothetical protein LH468_03470, partial [Nocardioides sp.]|nr:hypothetical protein [Nocardioides sp.]